MKRRDLLLAAASSSWIHRASVAWSQASERIKRIGVLLEYEQGDPEALARSQALTLGLRSHGWEEARNLHIEYRFAGGDPNRVRPLATELAKLKPDVLFGSGAPVTAALQAATQDIPIVFVQASDPVGAGLVPTLGRPGGNVTGFTNFEYAMAGKWLEILREAALNFENHNDPKSSKFRLAGLLEGHGGGHARRLR